MSACGPPAVERSAEPSAPAPEIQRLPPLSRTYYAPAACDADWRYSPPPAGARFTYAVVDGEGRPNPSILRVDTVREAEGSRVDYRMDVRMGDSVLESVQQQTISGVLPGSSAERSWTYRGLVEQQLAALTPGESLSFTGVETAEIGGETRSQEGPIRITLTGCGVGTDLIPAAEGEPLRIYRLERFWQTPAGVRRGEYEVALSQRWGWRMMDRDGGTIGVVTHATEE